jgi:arylsulfatase A-like enzyme
MPLFKETGTLDRDALFWHYPHYGNQGGTPGSSVRMGDWKLIEFFEDNRLELYNLKEDEGEQKDLASREPERVKTMGQKASCLAAESGSPDSCHKSRFYPLE